MTEKKNCKGIKKSERRKKISGDGKIWDIRRKDTLGKEERTTLEKKVMKVNRRNVLVERAKKMSV